MSLKKNGRAPEVPRFVETPSEFLISLSLFPLPRILKSTIFRQMPAKKNFARVYKHLGSIHVENSHALIFPAFRNCAISALPQKRAPGQTFEHITSQEKGESRREGRA